MQPSSHATSETVRRILIVDDDASVVAVLRGLLKRRGYLVDAAACTETARAHVRAVDYDVALVDVGLRDGCGMALAGELETEYGLAQRVIIITGGHPPRGERCFLKPFKYAELMAAIAEVAAQGAAARPPRADSALSA